MERRCVKRHRPPLSEAEIESDLCNCHRECVVKPRATASSPKTDNVADSSVYTQVICPYILARGEEGVGEREKNRGRGGVVRETGLKESMANTLFEIQMKERKTSKTDEFSRRGCWHCYFISR